MTNIFAYAERCLYDADIAQKLQLTQQAMSLCEQELLDYSDVGIILSAAEVCFPDKPKLLRPRDMPRRRLDTAEGRVAFYHALAHIEFMAIYLAWDIVYRFRGLPQAFYQDWLRIAAEEAEHFVLLREILLQQGVDYGDLPAHHGLWEHAVLTSDDVLARLAVVPRCMEARGLDVSPGMIIRLAETDDDDGVDVLSRIYQDEIGHVQCGSFWFKQFCEMQAIDAEQHFTDLLRKYFKGIPKGPFNREARIIAGFSDFELNWLEDYADGR